MVFLEGITVGRKYSKPNNFCFPKYIFGNYLETTACLRARWSQSDLHYSALSSKMISIHTFYIDVSFDDFSNLSNVLVLTEQHKNTSELLLLLLSLKRVKFGLGYSHNIIIAPHFLCFLTISQPTRSKYFSQRSNYPTIVRADIWIKLYTIRLLTIK